MAEKGNYMLIFLGFLKITFNSFLNRMRIHMVFCDVYP